MAFIPFRLKILGSFLALFVVVLTTSLFIIRHGVTKEIEAQVRSDLQVTRDVFDSFLQFRQKQLAVAVRLLGKDFAFVQLLGRRTDPDYRGTIASFAENLRQRFDADLVWFTDDQGLLFAAAASSAGDAKALRPGKSIIQFAVFAETLKHLENGDEEGASTLEIIGDKAYQLEAAPVVAAGEVSAVLVAGNLIDDETAKKINRQTRSDVSFEADGRIFASTLAPERRRILEANRVLPGAGSASPDAKIIGPAGRRELVAASKVSPRVTAYVQRSWEEAVEPLRNLQQILILIGVCGIALCFAAGLLIADGVTASMAELAQATDRLLEGDYSVQVDIRQRDEIGRLGNAFNRMVTGLQEKEKIRSVLRKAVSREIADELLKRGRINLGGETRSVTVLFADIRGFTTISENLSPQDLVGQLNAYFTKMSRAIELHRGVIDKYVGDAIMALFGAPLGSAGDADNAQRAALEMVRGLGELNRERAEQGLPPWSNGIGLNSGPAVAGTLGSENRWSYTVIGDSVNLSSRLEGLTKHYGVRILVSQETKEASRAGFLYRPLDLVRVKGKNRPVEIYELLGEDVSAPAWLATFEAGVRFYRGKEFQAARARFEDVLRAAPGDKPAAVYLERLDGLPASVPPDWDPAHTMLEK